MSDILGYQEAIPTGEGFTSVGDVLATAYDRAAHSNRVSPQANLERIVSMAIQKADNKLASQDNPPSKTFYASAMLKEIATDLKGYRAASVAKGGYNVLLQIISNEIDVIDRCLQGACINGADKVLSELIERKCAAAPVNNKPPVLAC